MNLLAKIAEVVGALNELKTLKTGLGFAEGTSATDIIAQFQAAEDSLNAATASTASTPVAETPVEEPSVPTDEQPAVEGEPASQ